MDTDFLPMEKNGRSKIFHFLQEIVIGERKAENAGGTPAKPWSSGVASAFLTANSGEDGFVGVAYKR